MTTPALEIFLYLNATIFFSTSRPPERSDEAREAMHQSAPCVLNTNRTNRPRPIFSLAVRSTWSQNMLIVLRRRYTIRFDRTEPADCPVHGSIVKCDMSLECPGYLNIGRKGITACSIFEPILPHELCDYPIRAQQTPKTTFTLYDHECVTDINALIVLRNIFASFNMEVPFS